MATRSSNKKTSTTKRTPMKKSSPVRSAKTTTTAKRKTTPSTTRTKRTPRSTKTTRQVQTAPTIDRNPLSAEQKADITGIVLIVVALLSLMAALTSQSASVFLLLGFEHNKLQAKQIQSQLRYQR